jgi:hypothetical protein
MMPVHFGGRQTVLVTFQTVVATANVLRTLRAEDARRALRQVLDLEPDLVGLQEWGLTRLPLLRETGQVGLVPWFITRRESATRPGFVWSAPLVGGCAVGARADRFELVECSSKVLSRVGRADKPDRWLGIEPPRLVTVGVYRDRRHDRTVSLLNYHLAPGVQAAGRYRADRPLLVARHQAEVLRLQQLVDAQLAQGHDVYAVGDSNFHGLRLAGLTSAWEGRDGEPGTLGSERKIDDVHGPGRATSVTLVASASDHKAVVVSRPDP